MKKALVVAATLAILAPSRAAHAQQVIVEADITAGYTTDEATALATQIRAFGETPFGLRVFSEASWAGRQMGEEEDVQTDAFGAAYPYGNRVQVIEAYAERLFRPGPALVGFRAGRYRTPFGIYARSDYAYTGFLRAPLLRYDGYFALSNNFLEHGAELIAGIPQLYVETSLGAPSDVGESQRRHGLNSVTRVQGFHGPLIVGVSRISTKPYFPERFAQGRSVFTGVDLRWTQSGIQILAEWITGHPFDGVSTDGWHADVIVHRPFMGPVTAMWRSEQLDYEAPEPRQRAAHRHTAGARVRLFRNFSAQANVLHQSGNLSGSYTTALDVALTYSLRLR